MPASVIFIRHQNDGTNLVATPVLLFHSFYNALDPKARLNTMRPRQDRRHLADDIFTCIFFNENCCILIKFSRKYVGKGPIDNNLALVQIMAWRRSGDKPLSEPMMISLPTHICVTRPQWVKYDVTMFGKLSAFLHSFTCHLTDWYLFYL